MVWFNAYEHSLSSSLRSSIQRIRRNGDRCQKKLCRAAYRTRHVYDGCLACLSSMGTGGPNLCCSSRHIFVTFWSPMSGVFGEEMSLPEFLIQPQRIRRNVERWNLGLHVRWPYAVEKDNPQIGVQIQPQRIQWKRRWDFQRVQWCVALSKSELNVNANWGTCLNWRSAALVSYCIGAKALKKVHSSVWDVGVLGFFTDKAEDFILLRFYSHSVAIHAPSLVAVHSLKTPRDDEA